VQKDMKLFPFMVVDREGKPVIRIENNNKEYQAEEISAMVLGKMKETAECAPPLPLPHA
jgi:heat shock protein 5